MGLRPIYRDESALLLLRGWAVETRTMDFCASTVLNTKPVARRLACCSVRQRVVSAQEFAFESPLRRLN